MKNFNVNSKKKYNILHKAENLKYNIIFFYIKIVNNLSYILKLYNYTVASIKLKLDHHLHGNIFIYNKLFVIMDVEMIDELINSNYMSDYIYGLMCLCFNRIDFTIMCSFKFVPDKNNNMSVTNLKLFVPTKGINDFFKYEK